jgi:hypothetical protein
VAGLLKDLLAMTVAELKEELEARGEGKSGNNSWLRPGGCMRRSCASICSRPEKFRASGAILLPLLPFKKKSRDIPTFTILISKRPTFTLPPPYA